MIQVPTWLAAVAGTFIVTLLTVIGYLVRLVVSVMHERLDSQDGKLFGVGTKLDEIKLALSGIDKRFVEAELSVTRQFVDKESYTRDFVTLTGRVDTVHKRVDRIEERDRDRRNKTG